MRAITAIAGKEIRDAVRNRWVVSATVLLAALALGLAFLGSAPTGTVDASRLALTIVSLASLSTFLVPLLALLLSFDAVVGEQERGTLLLLLAYPVSRLQLLAGKFLGHTLVLGFATVAGYGAAGLVIAVTSAVEPGQWLAFLSMIGSSVLLGCVFLALGYLVSVTVRERATAGGIAVAIWLAFVVLYDLALFGLLVADQGNRVSAPLFGFLLTLNPPDVYRLLNLGTAAEVRQLSGMAGLSDDVSLAPTTLIGALTAWVLVPLAAAVAVFRRREL